ncbi:serine/threonine-protein kinase Sgk2 [Ophiocordyceps sinensis CO18]|uniref:non-specific serine/threonine protein kinase n=1 Tax=Ophiocordyceps sinensis (strain Co18 / CGMCC 3.14243) TaxID=911162 RepID=T5A936_OPHSC|nr:serine/threonine-protein kinase Sgk2 [Ophiocordyceps sinensis CO18]
MVVYQIGDALEAFRESRRGVDSGDLDRDDLRTPAINLLRALMSIPATLDLPSAGTGTNLLVDLTGLLTTVHNNDFDRGRIKSLLTVVLADEPEDSRIWAEVYRAVAPTPRYQPIASSTQQSPVSQNTSGLMNSSEKVDDVKPIYGLELKDLHVGLFNFHGTFFGDVRDASEAVFNRCTEGDNPLFTNGWSEWPAGAEDGFTDGWSEWPAVAEEGDVQTWLHGLIPRLQDFARHHTSLPEAPEAPRWLLAQPGETTMAGSKAPRKLDAGFVNDNERHWSHVLVVGEMKSNPDEDTLSHTWMQLARYAREVFAAQDARRFVLGFTLCGSLMRVWEFDRLGGIASDKFDINTKAGGQQFVTAILGFLYMDKDRLGFDPTIKTMSGGERYIEINRKGQTELLIIDKVISCAPCIAGRGTTCWKVHRKEDAKTPLVIKDSWQFTTRDEEGEMLQEATTKQDVVNVARYYHHETVRVRNLEDDVRDNVRGGLDVTTATTQRPFLTSAEKARNENEVLPNRVHRRVVLKDYGMRIYMAGSRTALLQALADCIKGHKSLLEAGFLHRDISMNNLMVKEDGDNTSSPRGFLIDLDLAVTVRRQTVSGAQGRTGTRAFMAIGLLSGDQHSFMHDLESFFWVLFWVCIHYKGPGEGRVYKRYDKWNYLAADELAASKIGSVAMHRNFWRDVNKDFTAYYRPLIPVVEKLREVVFPQGKSWAQEDKENKKLYSQMRKVLKDERRKLERDGIH